MSKPQKSDNNSMPLPVAVATIKSEPLESGECRPWSGNNDFVFDNKNIKLEITQTAKQIKIEPKVEKEDEKTHTQNDPPTEGRKKNKHKYINPQIAIQKEKIKEAMKRTLLQMEKHQILNLIQSRPKASRPWKNRHYETSQRMYHSQSKAPSRDTDKVFYLQILDLPIDFTYNDAWNILKDCRGADILKLTMDSGPQSKNIVKVYFSGKLASVAAMKKLLGKTVNGQQLKMSFHTEEKNKNNVPVTTPAPKEAQSTDTTKRCRSRRGRSRAADGSVASSSNDVIIETIDLDSDAAEPAAKRPKENPVWRPDLDVYEMDPTGLYGLKPEFLNTLNIKPPINPWVLVKNFRCSRFELKEVLNLAGEVLICNVDHTPKTANIMYKHPLEAVQAVSMLNNQLLYGTKLSVEIDAAPPTSCHLPTGLYSVGPGLGIYGKPLRDVVRHYERYARKKCSLVDKMVFLPLDKILPPEVASAEDIRNNSSRKRAETISKDFPMKQETDNREKETDQPMNSQKNAQSNEDEGNPQHEEADMEISNDCQNNKENPENDNENDENPLNMPSTHDLNSAQPDMAVEEDSEPIYIDEENSTQTHDLNSAQPDMAVEEDSEPIYIDEENSTQTHDLNSAQPDKAVEEDSEQNIDEENSTQSHGLNSAQPDMAVEEDSEQIYIDEENSTQSDMSVEQNSAQRDIRDEQNSAGHKGPESSGRDTAFDHCTWGEKSNTENPELFVTDFGTEENSQDSVQDLEKPNDEPENRIDSVESVENSRTNFSPLDESSQNQSESSDSDTETQRINKSILELSNEIKNHSEALSSMVDKNHTLTNSNSTSDMAYVSSSALNQSHGSLNSSAPRQMGTPLSQTVLRPNISGQPQFNNPNWVQNIPQNRPVFPQNFGPPMMPQNVPTRYSGPVDSGPPNPLNVRSFNVVGGQCVPIIPSPMRMMGPVGGPSTGLMAGQMNPSMGARMPGPNPIPMPISGPRGPIMPRLIDVPIRMPGPTADPMKSTFHAVEIRNLPLSTTFSFLCTKMSECGQVTSVKLTAPGCAVVQFAQYSHAKACWQLYNNTCIQGNVVTVTLM